MISKIRALITTLTQPTHPQLTQRAESNPKSATHKNHINGLAFTRKCARLHVCLSLISLALNASSNGYGHAIYQPFFPRYVTSVLNVLTWLPGAHCWVWASVVLGKEVKRALDERLGEGEKLVEDDEGSNIDGGDDHTTKSLAQDSPTQTNRAELQWCLGRAGEIACFATSFSLVKNIWTSGFHAFSRFTSTFSSSERKLPSFGLLGTAYIGDGKGAVVVKMLAVVVVSLAILWLVLFATVVALEVWACGSEVAVRCAKGLWEAEVEMERLEVEIKLKEKEERKREAEERRLKNACAKGVKGAKKAKRKW